MTFKLCETVCAVSSYVGCLAAIVLGSAATAEESSLLFAAAAACNVAAVALRIIGSFKSTTVCKHWYNYIEGVFQACSIGCLNASAFIPTNLVLGGSAVGVSIVALIVRFVGDLFLFWKQDRVNEQVVESVQLVEVRVEPFSFINALKSVVRNIESVLRSISAFNDVKVEYGFSDKLCKVRECLFRLLENTDSEEEKRVLSLMLYGESLSENKCLDGVLKEVRLRAERLRDSMLSFKDRFLLAEKGLLSQEEIRLLRCSFNLALDEAQYLNRDISGLISGMKSGHNSYQHDLFVYSISLASWRRVCSSNKRFDFLAEADIALCELKIAVNNINQDQRVVQAFNDLDRESLLLVNIIKSMDDKLKT